MQGHPVGLFEKVNLSQARTIKTTPIREKTTPSNLVESQSSLTWDIMTLLVGSVSTLRTMVSLPM